MVKYKSPKKDNNQRQTQNDINIQKEQKIIKIITFLGNTTNRLSKFRTKNWVEIILDRNGVYTADQEIKFKTRMIKSSLCDYNNGKNN